MRFAILFFFLFLASSVFSQLHHTDTLHIFYQTDQATLAPKSKLILDEYMKNILGQKDSITIAIEGFTDKKGNDEYNINLSQNRANSIKIYLLTSKVPEKYFTTSIGKGKTDISMVLPSRMTDSLCRRVDVYITYFSYKKPVKTKISDNKSAYKPILDVKSFVEGKKINIPNLNFYPGEHRLYTTSYDELKNIANILKENPALEIQINGHVCCLLKDQKDGYDVKEDTWNLSEKRAEEVYNYFVNYGIDASRLSYKGLGGSQKIVQYEQTESDRIQNRRVEIIVLKQ